MRIRLNPKRMVIIKNKDNSCSIIAKQGGFEIEIGCYKSDDLEYTMFQTEEVLSYIQKEL